MPTGVAVPALALLLAGAAIPAFQGSPWPFWFGMALAAGAPLAFILAKARATSGLTGHPLTISVISGLGCVAVMIGHQRFGADGAWTLPAALAGLIVWMLWQRRQRRSATPS